MLETKEIITIEGRREKKKHRARCIVYVKEGQAERAITT